MIEKFKISLWDLLTFFVSGLLLLLIFNYYEFELRLPLIFKAEAGNFVDAVIYIVLVYTIGVIFEPVSNILFSMLIKLYEWKTIFKKLKKLVDERDTVYYPEVKRIAIEKFGFTDEKTDYYQVARTFLVQKNIETLYMIFLAKFGFYRNLSILLFGNLFLFPILKHDDFSTIHIILITICIFFLHVFMYVRGREFYLYTGNEIYRNFVMWNK